MESFIDALSLRSVCADIDGAASWRDESPIIRQKYDLFPRIYIWLC